MAVLSSILSGVVLRHEPSEKTARNSMAPRERASWRSNGFDPSGLIHLSFRQAFTRSELYWFWTRTGHWRRMTNGCPRNQGPRASALFGDHSSRCGAWRLFCRRDHERDPGVPAVGPVLIDTDPPQSVRLANADHYERLAERAEERVAGRWRQSN